MPSQSNSILLFGLDEMLLKTRRWILEQLGYRVVCVTRIEEMEAIPPEPPMQLLVLCQTLDLARRTSALALASARWPGIRNLSMAPISRGPRVPVEGEALAALYGPAEFIATVKTLTS